MAIRGDPNSAVVGTPQGHVRKGRCLYLIGVQTEAGIIDVVAPVHIEPGISDAVQMQQEVARYTFSALWRRKWTIVGMVLVCILPAAGVLVVMPPQYSSEAVIQLNFDRHEPNNRPRNRSIATLDPASLVDGEIQVIHSRQTASAVVTRLGLEKDPAFTRPPTFSIALDRLRSAMGAAAASPTPHDRAVATLMRKVQVLNRPHSYLISIAVTSVDPGQARLLANAVAEEYLRVAAIRNLVQEESDARTEIAILDGEYGKRHPSVQRGELRLEQIRKHLDRLRHAPSSADILALADAAPSFIPADKSSVPSGPKARLILAAAGLLGCAGGIFLALRRQRRDERMLATGDEHQASGYRMLGEGQVAPS